MPIEIRGEESSVKGRNHPWLDIRERMKFVPLRVVARAARVSHTKAGYVERRALEKLRILHDLDLSLPNPQETSP